MFDVVIELESRGVSVRRNSSREAEFLICCPFCVDANLGPDESFHLGFNILSGKGHCFRCGWKSGAALLHILRRLRIGGSYDPAQVFYTPEEKEKSEPVRLPVGFEALAELGADDVVFSQAVKYAVRRGITRRQLMEKEIGATITDDRYRYRLIFPVKDAANDLVGFVGRDWTGHHPAKYMNSMGTTKSVYNARPDKYPCQIIVLSEGVTKSLAIERALDYEFCSAASLGNSLTDNQIQQLKDFDEVVLFPDPDKAGMHGYLEMAANLAGIKKTTMAWPWPKKQADDLTGKEVLEHLKARKKYTMTMDWKLRIEAGLR